MKTIELTEEEIEKLNNGDNVVIDKSGYETTDDSAGNLQKKYFEDITIIKKKHEKWKPKKGFYAFDTVNSPHELRLNWTENQLKSIVENGLTRDSISQAARADKQMRTFNRLLAYVDEFEIEIISRLISYCVHYNTKADKFYYTNSVVKCIGGIYMSRPVAEELCRKLNSGEVVL